MTTLQVADNATSTLPPPSDTAKRASRRSLRRQRRLALALQGGGSFGSFTWGVLDRLLDADFAFDAVSGTSAGALNAVLLADGLAEGGPEAAKRKLAHFWKRVSDTAPLPLPTQALELAAPIMSPY